MARRRLMRLASECVDEPDDRNDDYTAEDAAADRGDRLYHEWADGTWHDVPPSERPLWCRELGDLHRRLDDQHRR